jgi:predicted metalloprotease with PDZ domain
MRTSAFYLLPLLLIPVFAPDSTFAQDSARAQNSTGSDSTITLKVDATDAPRRLFHVHMTMPAKPGPLTLVYPKWIPGEHMPVGPITNLVGLKIMAAGQPVAWRRDNVNMYAFHIEVPPGAASLDVAFDYISPLEVGSGSTSGSSVTSELAVLNWNQTVLYPQGSNPDQMRYQATLQVPAGWRYGTALPLARESGNQIEFQPASLTTLIDSPVSAGIHYRTVDLGSDGGAQHYVHIAADSERALDATPETIQHWKNMVAETGALFGSRHYRSYHFLFTLSDHTIHQGVEHHESSDDRDFERTLIDPDLLKADTTLLPHEMTHSWNGKFRRPVGLATGGYDAPMQGDLLWIYEGLTNYLGEVLAARSGLWSAADYRDSVAITAAQLDRESGRTWRPLEDTAVAAQLLYMAPDEYSEYRRSVDYYPEGSLIWLETDVLIRSLSKGAKSLNDFCRSFEGGPGGQPELKPYNLQDVVTALNAVQPYDWNGFFQMRLHSTEPHAPLGGISRGGWKLVYNGTRSDLWKAYEEYDKHIDLSYSVGLKVKEDGTIEDVAWNGPSAQVGIAPGSKIIAVNSRQFDAATLRDAVQRASTVTSPIELLLKTGEYYKTYKVDYHGGDRYPHLERDDTTADLISVISAPLAKK